MRDELALPEAGCEQRMATEIIKHEKSLSLPIGKQKDIFL